MASPTGLSAAQLRLLGQLKRLDALDDFYLAGGSAVGWHFEHRRSLDLDLFSTSSDTSLARVALEMTRTGAEVQGETDVAVHLGLPAASWQGIKRFFSEQAARLMLR